MDAGYRDLLDSLAAQHAELAGLLAGLDAAGWATPTPRCPGWTVRETVLHLAQTDELAEASLRGSFEEVLETLSAGVEGATSVDDGVARMVEAERAATVDKVQRRWSQGAERLRQQFEATDPSRRVRWVAGELSARTLAATRIAECWIHTGDIAHGLGVELAPGDQLRHIARLAWRTLRYAFGQAGRELDGPVAFELRGPSGEAWTFAPEEPPATVITGDALELCLVAGRRAAAADTGLAGRGPDAEAVLELVRTYA